MKNWFYKLYMRFVADLAEEITIKLRPKPYFPSEHEKFEKWKKQNSKLIHRTRAIALLQAVDPWDKSAAPSEYDIYLKTKA